MKTGHRVKKKWIFAAALLVFSIWLFVCAARDVGDGGASEKTVYHIVFADSMRDFSPLMSYVGGDWKSGSAAQKVWQIFYAKMPLERYIQRADDSGAAVTEYMQEETAPETAFMEGGSGGASLMAEQEQDKAPGMEIVDGVLLAEAVLAENTAAAGVFVPVQSPVALYTEQQLAEPGFIKETFYSEDATTYIREDQLDYDTLMGFDATMKQDSGDVQILVYHTHSQEAYIDSVPGDASTSVVGVGEHLCDILRTQYGFNVLHHTGEYDVESRDYAYSNAMVGLEQALAEHPTIEVMIDLHRDETDADTKLVTDIQGRQTAKFMFFNGLCYTRALGALDNLPNPYIQENLSFAFQLELAAEEYYPGLTRRIYLKGYRYNLHYRPKSLLIELGSQTNTVEEAMNACEPLAHILAMVLNGENKE